MSTISTSTIVALPSTVANTASTILASTNTVASNTPTTTKSNDSPFSTIVAKVYSDPQCTIPYYLPMSEFQCTQLVNVTFVNDYSNGVYGPNKCADLGEQVVNGCTNVTGLWLNKGRAHRSNGADHTASGSIVALFVMALVSTALVSF
ncbi:hypothetical protein HDU97_006764 [Phlyctochytrium planicorne]|nr:hypothetical protein HDU97_006764 [Phlyctochytrium planicorne]